MDVSRTSAAPAPSRLWAWQAKASPYLFITPFIALFLAFLVYPLTRSIILSFYNSSGPRRSIFIGLDNYTFLIRDRLFWLAVANTVLYTILFLSLQIPLSLGLALLLNNKAVRFRNFFRFAFFSSHLVGNVFVAVLFTLLLAPRQGLVNQMIGAVFPFIGTELNWRGNAVLAMPAIVLASLWLSIGYGMIYFLAALQAVDPELYEAAEVDGAGRFGKFWHITIPGIRPVLVFILLVGTIGAFQLFELPYVFFDGPGPGFAGLTIVMYLYQNGFEGGNIGYASAIGWMLASMIFVVSLLQLKLTPRDEGDLMARRATTAENVGIVLLHVLLVALAAFTLLPFLWLICAAFKQQQDIFTSAFLPWRNLSRLTFENISALFTSVPFSRWLFNSLFLASTQTVIIVTLSSLGGFALAKYRFRGQKLIMLLMLATMLLPGQVLLPSMYELMYRIGWIDSYAAILIPGAVSVFGMFLFRQAMQSVPDELLHAGRVDGCSEIRLWWEIALPLVRPMLGAFTLLAFLGSWNSYLWPQIVLQDPTKYTLPIGLANMVGLPAFETQYGVLMAGTLLGIVPVVVLFFILQRDFISGLASGALKS